jgi:hypothetical protein
MAASARGLARDRSRRPPTRVPEDGTRDPVSCWGGRARAAWRLSRSPGRSSPFQPPDRNVSARRSQGRSLGSRRCHRRTPALVRRPVAFRSLGGVDQRTTASVYARWPAPDSSRSRTALPRVGYGGHDIQIHQLFRRRHHRWRSWTIRWRRNPRLRANAAAADGDPAARTNLHPLVRTNVALLLGRASAFSTACGIGATRHSLRATRPVASSRVRRLFRPAHE